MKRLTGLSTCRSRAILYLVPTRDHGQLCTFVTNMLLMIIGISTFAPTLT